jgi:alkaline phosphatase
VNHGSDNLPGMEWHSTSHTNSLIPFYARGDGARLFRDLADQRDPVRGPYLDNTELAEVIFKSLNP